MSEQSSYFVANQLKFKFFLSEFNVAKWFKPKKFIQIVKQTTLYERIAILYEQRV